TQEETQQDDNVPTPSNDLPLSGEDIMQLSEMMLLCTNLQKQVLDLEKAKDAQAKEIVNLKKRGRSIEDIDINADVSLVDDTQCRNKYTLAQTLIQIKAAKPKVVNTAATTTTTTTRPKARGVVVQELNQVALDEDLARNLQAQLEAEIVEEEKLARKQEEEANIALIEERATSLKRQRMEDDKEIDEHEEVEVDDEVELKSIGEDLETLWKLVKTKHGDTRPEDEHERVLWGNLKVMFEPNIKSDV
ncbi:hypothetical protein Tco_0601552, partial [Tanacetum coccineum]